MAILGSGGMRARLKINGLDENENAPGWFGWKSPKIEAKSRQPFQGPSLLGFIRREYIVDIVACLKLLSSLCGK